MRQRNFFILTFGRLDFLLLFFIFLLLLFPSSGLSGKEPLNRFFADRFIYTQEKDPSSSDPSAFIEVVELIGQARVFRGDRALFANRIKVIGRNMDQAFAYGNVRVFDYKENTVLKGGYGEYHKMALESGKESFTRVTENPELVYTRKENPAGKTEYEKEPFQVNVYGKVFTRLDLQKKILIDGPVSFTKSNEFFKGVAQRAEYFEADDLLQLWNDCRITRGDDLYLAGYIAFYTGKNILNLKNDVQMTLYDYRLDPFEPTYVSPFQEKKILPVNKTVGNQGQGDPFQRRKYALLEKLKPENGIQRFQLRQFIESRADLFGDEMVYNGQDEKAIEITVRGNGLYRNQDGIFVADFLKVKAKGEKIILGYGNLYFEGFKDSSFTFGRIFEYLEGQKWARIYNRAHAIMVTDSNSSEKSTFPVQSTHLYGDEIERLFEEKKIYLKGKVRIHRLNQKFKSTYAIYRENERVVDLIGAPEIQKTDSYLISNLITMDLKKEIASLDQNVLGVFYQEKKEGQTGNVIIESGFFSNNKKIDRILQSGIDPRVWGQIALPEPNFY